MEFDLSVKILGQLVLAAALGGLIGLERALHQKAAGLRTNMFICVGSALFTVLSDEFGSRFGGDHARVAAQLIPGIGFIGAGAIIRDRGSVVGLTTAATIFVIASIGMAVGTGLYFTAIFTTILVVVGLSGLGWAEQRFIPRSRPLTFRLTTTNMEMAMGVSKQALMEMKLAMQNFQLFRVGEDFLIEFVADVVPSQQQQIVDKLSPIVSKLEVVPFETPRD